MKIRIVGFAVLILLAIPCQAQQSLQVLHNHVRSAVSNRRAALVGPLSPERRMNVSIVLPPRNEIELRSLLSRLYDPHSPEYRHFLSVDGFTEQFGPTLEDYQAVVEFAQANGFTVTGAPANRMLVPISGSVAQIEKAFHISMGAYRHPTESRAFFSPDREPSLNLSVPVAHIAGLNNFSPPHPLVRKAPARQALTSQATLGSGPGGSYLPRDMRVVYYGGTALTGSGQALGLAEFDGYNISDVTSSFDGTATSNANGSDYVLTYTPQVSGATYQVPINNVLLDGANGSPVTGDDAEEVLDIVQAIGMAPGLSQVRVYIGNNDTDVLNAMASENIAKQLSISWTWTPEDPYLDDFLFQEFAAQGQSVFAASGDYGEFDPLIDNFFPAEDAWVTSVGGTTLITNGAGAWSSEVAWTYSGGGISPDGFSIPNWQAGVASLSNGGSTTLRNAPDVAAEADFDNYNCSMTVCHGDYAGTSFAAPRWAAFMALVNQQAVAAGNPPVGFINPAIYAIGASSDYSRDFHDITVGNNSTEGNCCGQAFFYAVPGYDLVTGWGSPTGQGLIDSLAPPASIGFQLSASPGSLTINPGGSSTTTVTIDNQGGFTGSVDLAVSGLPSGVTGSFAPNHTIGTSVLTLNVSGSASRGSYLLTITGVSGAVNATTTLALAVNAPGFGIYPVDSTMLLYPGISETNNITVMDFAGFTDSVVLAVTSGLPSGVTASWGTNPTTGSSALTLTASDSATVERSMVTITGISGALSATTTIGLTVNRAPQFHVNISPIPYTLVQGTSLTVPVTLVPIGSFSGAVALSAPLLPAGVSASFSSNPATGSSVLTLTTDSSAPLQTSLLEIMGTAVGIPTAGPDSFEFNPTVTATPAPTYTVGTSAMSLTLTQGNSGSSTITVTPQNGFTGSVTLGTAALPSGVSATFGTNPTTGSSLLTVTASGSAAAGPFPLTVTGTFGGRSVPVVIMTVINQAPSFSLGASPASVTVVQGSSGTSSITVTPQIGFSGSVTLGAPNLPGGLSASFSPNPTSAASVLTLSANGSIPAGNYPVIITGASGPQTVTTTLAVTVTPPATLPSFTLGATPASMSLNPGTSGTSSITVSPQSGFNGSVTLGASGLPSGLTASFAPNPTTGTSTLTLTAGNSVSPGNYPLTITGTSGSLTANTPISLNVIVPTTTALSITPSGGTLAAGASYTLTATVSPTSGSTTPTGNVVFSIGSAAPTVVLNSSGIATFTGTAPATGTVTISAAYQGTAAFSGSTSSSTAFTVNNPVPVVTSLSPASVTAGAAAQTLTINGTNFVSTSTVTYSGAAHTVTFVSSTQLTISLSTSDQATAGSYAVVVSNPAPGGGLSSSVNLTVNNPVPAITSLFPASVTAGSAARTLTINGTNFLSTSTVTYNGLAHTATFVSSTQLSISLSMSNQGTAGSYAVVVSNPTPGGGASNSVNFTVNNAVPAITSLSPVSVTVGAAAQTVTISGANFLSTSTVTYNGVAHTATFVSSTQLTISLSASDQAAVGSYAVVASNPAPGGGASNSVNFTVNNPVPGITSLSPASVTVGAAAQTVTISGTNFLSTATVTYNGAAHTATFVSSTQLTISLTTSDLAAVGSYALMVGNPVPGGGVSNLASFSVSNPVPAITSISVTSYRARAAAETLTINGANFVSTSTVICNGVAHTPISVGSTQLTISLSTSDQATAETYAVVVSNPAPGGGASNLVSFAVNNSVPSHPEPSPGPRPGRPPRPKR